MLTIYTSLTVGYTSLISAGANLTGYGARFAFAGVSTGVTHPADGLIFSCTTPHSPAAVSTADSDK